MTYTLDLTNTGWFSGLYQSLWLDEELLQDALTPEEYQLLDDGVDFKAYLTRIGEEYINFFGNFLQIPFEDITIKEIYSPRYYNYDTDHIVLEFKNLNEVHLAELNSYTDEQKQMAEDELFFKNPAIVIG